MKRIDNSECLKDFGDWIRKEREKRELSQEELGAMVGLHRTYIGKIELANRVVDLNVAIMLCKALGLDLADFIKTHI